MPISKDKAPGTLPDAAKNIYVAAWNAAYDDTCKERSDRDSCASKIAWSAVKNKYVQHSNKWVPKAALVDIDLVITKASLQADGSMHWLAVASDTTPDRTGEATSLGLFRDWIERVETGKGVTFLPPPRRPFLGVSHYPALDGLGEAGQTERMYIDGKRFNTGGTFSPDSAVGKALFKAIRNERDLIKRGETIEQPIRISAGWWDLAHSHGSFVFERKSSLDVCPMCEQGVNGKIYLKGQLDHFAATRVPINPRTSVTLEEKSMATQMTTRKADAASIIGDELAEELEKQVKPVGKSETEQSAAMVTKADKKKPDKPMMDDEEMMSDVREPQSNEDEISDSDKEKKKKKEEKADIENDYYSPFGGAMSLEAADEYMTGVERAEQVRSNWMMFQEVMANIMEFSPPDELKANVKKLVDEFGSRVEAIKAAVEDAVLIDLGDFTMTDQTQVQAHPADALKAAVDEALANNTLNRAGKFQAIQSALEGYAEAVKAEVNAIAPPDPGETIKAALEPILDKLNLIAEKLSGQATASVQAPQQKSFIPKSGSSQPEIMQKPPTLRETVRRSVGIQY